MKQKRDVDVDLVTKSKGKVDFPSMWVRKITVPISIGLAKYTYINPSHITYFSVLVMVISLGLLGYSGYSSNPFLFRFIGASLIFVTYLLDHLDGKMARMLKVTSLRGKWVDEVSGFLYLSFIFIALFIGMRVNDYKTAVLTMFAAVAAPLHYLVIYSYKYGIEPKMIIRGVEILKKDSWLKYVYGPIYMYVLIIIFCAINKPEYILYFWAFTENLFWIGIAILQFRAIQKFERRLDS